MLYTVYYCEKDGKLSNKVIQAASFDEVANVCASEGLDFRCIVMEFEEIARRKSREEMENIFEKLKQDSLSRLDKEEFSEALRSELQDLRDLNDREISFRTLIIRAVNTLLNSDDKWSAGVTVFEKSSTGEEFSKEFLEYLDSQGIKLTNCIPGICTLRLDKDLFVCISNSIVGIQEAYFKEIICDKRLDVKVLGGHQLICARELFSHCICNTLDLATSSLSCLADISCMFSNSDIGLLDLRCLNITHIVYACYLFSNAKIGKLVMPKGVPVCPMDVSYMFSSARISQLIFGKLNSRVCGIMWGMFESCKIDSVAFEEFSLVGVLSPEQMFKNSYIEGMLLDNTSPRDLVMMFSKNLAVMVE